MQHMTFTGTHYEIGYRLGTLLAAQFLPQNAPFPITEERRAFARACELVYRVFFPEILEEIQGLADGQQCAAETLQAILFGMYALPPTCGCSCFAVSDGAHILLGRNSDFLTALEHLNANITCRFPNSPSFAFTGNTTAFLEMEDGVNERGLAIGLTAIPAFAPQPGMNAGLLLRYLLEKCRDTGEALQQISRIPLSSAHTLTLADAKGNIARVECHPRKTTVIRPTEGHPFVCATNQFQADGMRPLQSPNADNWQAKTRFLTLEHTLRRRKGRIDVPAAKVLLAGKYGFLCQYDRAQGMDTVWSVLYDLKEDIIWRAEGNPARTALPK